MIRRCLACRQRASFIKSIVFGKYYYEVCANCGIAILQPRTKALKEIKKSYNKKYFTWTKASGTKSIIYNVYLHEDYPEFIGRFKDPGVMIDIGAGKPDFVVSMKKLGWDVYAQELSREQAKKIALKIGKTKVVKGKMEKANLPNDFFNVVTLWHVFEHLENPSVSLKKIWKILKKEGLVFIEVPNWNSFTLHIFGEDYSLRSIPEHLFYYNGKSLRNIFEKEGFKVVEITYPLKYNTAFSSSLAKGNQLLFYILLPVSMLINFLGALVGKTEVVRVVLQKKGD